MYTTAGATSTSTSASVSTATSPSSSSSATTTPTQDASSSSSTADAQCEENHDVAIGAGVGVPLGLAALICLGMWVRERRARKRDLKTGMVGQSGYVDANGNGVYQANYGVVNGVSDRKHPMELGDGRRPEELP